MMSSEGNAFQALESRLCSKKMYDVYHQTSMCVSKASNSR